MATLRLDYRRHVRRPIGFLVFGIVLMIISGVLGYDVWQRSQHTGKVSTAYNYTVDQTINKGVTYTQSSFFDNGPGSNTGYIMDITDKLKVGFKYDFKASAVNELTYVYDVKAIVKGKYSFQAEALKPADVWTKQFQLLRPVQQTMNTDTISLDLNYEVPYAEYRKLIESLRSALTLPIDSETVVTLTVHVWGDVGGKRFDDVRVSSVTAPFGEQIYQLSEAYDKHDSKQIIPVATQDGINKQTQLEAIAAGAVGVLGIASLVYGVRRRIFKTPYQRELDRIYRYYDGIVVRTSKPADLTGRRIIPVRTFEDMLNLEEELKSPILATPAGGEATRFIIMQHDVAYVYQLGNAREENNKSLEQIANTATIRDVAPSHPTHSAHTVHHKKK